jgi:hypothetical protein
MEPLLVVVDRVRLGIYRVFPAAETADIHAANTSNTPRVVTSSPFFMIPP